MIDYLLAVIIGVLSGFTASFIFLLFLTMIKPKIIISKQIAKNCPTSGQVNYQIKIINKTANSIINVKAQLFLITPIVMPGGLIEQNVSIPLKTSELMELSKFDVNDKTGGYIFRFVCEENIEKKWTDENRSFLRFKIFATHPLSGSSRVFSEDYHIIKNSIEEGKFEFGNSLKIK